MMCTPVSGVALILTLLLRAYSPNRSVMQSGDAKATNDAEEAIELEASSMKDVEDGTEMTHTNSIAVVGWSDKDRVTLQV
jgi:hypothetical protein